MTERDGLPDDHAFPRFVLSLAHTVAVHLGDVRDPVTGSQGAP